MTHDTSARFRAAIERFDAANSHDPHRVTVDGREEPASLAGARRMSGWLGRLVPDASEALRLAVRCHHLRRWTFPRDAYPMTRAGYHQWRTAAARGHAELAGAVLREVGYDEATVERVGALVRKEGLRSDPETQALEDAACLVFLETGFAEFAERHDEAKIVGILQRTWRKMSPQGHAAALTLDLPPGARALVERALSAPS
jgi:hypothetical protein